MRTISIGSTNSLILRTKYLSEAVIFYKIFPRTLLIIKASKSKKNNWFNGTCFDVQIKWARRPDFFVWVLEGDWLWLIFFLANYFAIGCWTKKLWQFSITYFIFLSFFAGKSSPVNFKERSAKKRGKSEKYIPAPRIRTLPPFCWPPLWASRMGRGGREIRKTLFSGGGI